MNNQNSNNRPTFRDRIKRALFSSASRKIHQPDQPYIPQPDPTPNGPNIAAGTYSETEAEVEQIQGISVNFGTEKIVHIDDNGHAKELTRKPNYIIGSGKRISSIDEIGGICPFCQEIAFKAYRENLINVQEAQLRSLFDVNSAARCDICGITACTIHCRPIQSPEGIFTICPVCRKQLKKQEVKRKIFSFLLSPIIKFWNEP